MGAGAGAGAGAGVPAARSRSLSRAATMVTAREPRVETGEGGLEEKRYQGQPAVNRSCRWWRSRGNKNRNQTRNLSGRPGLAVSKTREVVQFGSDKEQSCRQGRVLDFRGMCLTQLASQAPNGSLVVVGQCPKWGAGRLGRLFVWSSVPQIVSCLVRSIVQLPGWVVTCCCLDRRVAHALSRSRRPSFGERRTVSWTRRGGGGGGS